MDEEPVRDEVLRRIRHALGTMPERSYAVFVRKRYRDMDYREIAAELGLSVRQVERAFAAALAHIDRCVDGDGGP